VLAQLLAPQQVFRRGWQVAALPVEVAHADVHVGRATQRALLRGNLQCPFVGAHRLAQTPLGDPDVGQRDRAAERVRDVPRPL
jgi:hypothetical protein